MLFQSTPSGGKATLSSTEFTGLGGSFNPRLPGGRRRDAKKRTQACDSFNPRLPGGRRPEYLGLLCPVPARYCSMIRIFRVALGTICPYIRFLRYC